MSNSPTPTFSLYAVKGTDFVQTIVMAEDGGAAVDTSGASATLSIKFRARGMEILSLSSPVGIVFGVSNMTITIPEMLLSSVPSGENHFDLFLDLANDAKRKIMRGTFFVE